MAIMWSRMRSNNTEGRSSWSTPQWQVWHKAQATDSHQQVDMGQTQGGGGVPSGAGPPHLGAHILRSTHSELVHDAENRGLKQTRTAPKDKAHVVTQHVTQQADERGYTTRMC